MLRHQFYYKITVIFVPSLEQSYKNLKTNHRCKTCLKYSYGSHVHSGKHLWKICVYRGEKLGQHSRLKNVKFKKCKYSISNKRHTCTMLFNCQAIWCSTVWLYATSTFQRQLISECQVQRSQTRYRYSIFYVSRSIWYLPLPMIWSWCIISCSSGMRTSFTSSNSCGRRCLMEQDGTRMKGTAEPSLLPV